MRRWGAMLVVVLLCGCAASTTPTSEGAATVAKSRCEMGSPALVAVLRVALKPGVTLTSVRTVQSNDFGKVWFVAGEIRGAGVPEKTIALWATNDNTGQGGQMYSVNGNAKSFSTWGDGGNTEAKLSDKDDGAQDAIKCAR